MNHRRALAISVSLALLGLSSCTVRQDLTMRMDASGAATVHVELQDGFYQYLWEMNQEAGVLGLDTTEDVFDLNRVEESFGKFPGVTLVRALSPSPKTLEIHLVFDDVESIVPEDALSDAHPLFTFEKNGTRRSFRVYYDVANYLLMAPMIPGSGSPLFEVLGPQPTEPYTKEEYLDVLAFMMGDEGPRWARESMLQVKVRVPGRVVSQKGGTQVPGGVDFDIPVLDLLLLRAPLVYVVEFEGG